MSHPIDPPGSLSLPFVEGLYEDYLRNPETVSPDWRAYFENLENGDRPPAGTRFKPGFRRNSIFNPPGSSGLDEKSIQLASLQDRVNQLVRNYRVRGHRIAKLDPLGLPRPSPPELELDFFEFTPAELDQPILCETLHNDRPLTIPQILQKLRNTYCRSIGAQYMHIDDIYVRRWLQRRMERTENRLDLSRDEQLRILTRLTDAVTFEEFIRKKFVGAKSFSLEGSESLIPLLDLAIEAAGGQGVKEIVLGMAHRGRLNVLANIMGKNPRDIFREFADKDPDLYTGRGDVKYHLGYSNDWQTANGENVHLSLCFNPSHLEFVNTVAMGRTRAKQDRVEDSHQESCMTLLIHGDASFSGQGVIQETLNMSQLPGYSVGGTLHVIVNNQIGFTTSPVEGRSTVYAAGVARMLQIPLFHVNGEDPEAVAQVVRLAMDYRKTFKRDVVIDMYAYRRLGHNEGDEPSFTQPVLYKAIRQRKPVREGYLDNLLQLSDITREEADDIAEKRREHLEQELSHATSESYSRPAEKRRGVWLRNNFMGGPEDQVEDVHTGISSRRLSDLLQSLTFIPEDFNLHPKLERMLEHRREMAEGKRPLDWAAAEALAFTSLALEGTSIRLTGQDVRRGTFSHRHGVWYDHEDGLPHYPFQEVDPTQARVDIYNSPLCEIGVLGFEYGYSLDCPDGLVLWEAQFGDFANVAQVIIDQFITSAEDKWRRLSNLVMLLPHGFEGQGPEHSSARLERFLTLAAEDNIQVVNLTTPAQYFHALRRQVLRPWRKPLVVMSPKSLLRHPRVSSSLEDLEKGTFQRLIPDPVELDPSGVRRVLICSGKLFYELEDYREKHERKDVAILRLEQIYPLQAGRIDAQLAPYPEGTPLCWVQEEPENMGAWRFLKIHLADHFQGVRPFLGFHRPASASPATGSAHSHRKEQAHLIESAFALD